MILARFIQFVANMGVSSTHQLWEVHLIRKLNLSSLLGIFNLFVAMVIFHLIGYPDMFIEIACCLVFSPLVIFLNKRKNYIAASYVFAMMGIVVFFLLSVRLGQNSLSFLYYFPLIIGLTQMLGRRETIFHLTVQLAVILFSVIISLYCNQNSLLQSPNFGKYQNEIQMINIVFSFFTVIVFTTIITLESIKQENQLKAVVKQKEILLAELFHRVKNNLNLVTSILNLKKNSIRSDEAKTALEETRNMVFSMAMVHTKVYNSSSIDFLNIRDYLSDLVKELINSLGGEEKVDFDYDCPDLVLNIAQAIPCGLIVNELVTNAFKHAQVPGRKLKITLRLKEEGGMILLDLNDNGPGRTNVVEKDGSLGLELISSLSEQLEGTHQFTNDNGFRYKLKFRK